MSNPNSGRGPALTTQQTQSLFNLTSGKGYHRGEIYAHSTDGKGHYESVRVKITPSVEAEIAQLVASRIRDYRTVEDFVRNSIIHQLHYEISTVWPQGLNILDAETMRSDINRRQAQIDTWRERIVQVSNLGEQYLNIGALEEMGVFLTQYDQDFMNTDMPEVLRQELEAVLDMLHDRYKRAVRKEQPKKVGHNG